MHSSQHTFHFLRKRQLAPRLRAPKPMAEGWWSKDENKKSTWQDEGVPWSWKNEDKGWQQWKHSIPHHEIGLFKTKMCSYFEKGNCRYQEDPSKCRWAHGQNDLRLSPPRLSRSPGLLNQIMVATTAGTAAAMVEVEGPKDGWLKAAISLGIHKDESKQGWSDWSSCDWTTNGSQWDSRSGKTEDKPEAKEEKPPASWSTSDKVEQSDWQGGHWQAGAQQEWAQQECLVKGRSWPAKDAIDA